MYHSSGKCDHGSGYACVETDSREKSLYSVLFCYKPETSVKKSSLFFFKSQVIVVYTIYFRMHIIYILNIMITSAENYI